MALDLDQITGQIVDVAYKMHVQLGPGLLESVYETVMVRELRRRGLKVEQQRRVSFEFEGMSFEHELCVDLLVEDRVVVELKVPIGLLINFGAGALKEGLHRIVNQLQPSATSPLAVNRPLPTETGPSLPGDGPER
jgi:iron complex transport system substrate-binding protein